MWAEEDEADLEQIIDDTSIDDEAKCHKLEKVLIEAAQNGNTERIHEMLGNPDVTELIDVNNKDDSGSNALIYAVCYGNENAVVELLRFGAKPDIRDRNEWTALMWAVQNQNLAIVQRLIESGADVNLTTSTGRSAITICPEGTPVYSYLQNNGYIPEAPAQDFYHAAEDPADAEARFQRQLEESSQALGLGVGSLEDDITTWNLDTVKEDEDFEFDWTTTHVSFPVAANQIPRYLDLCVTNYKVGFSKGQQPTSANCIFLASRHFRSTDADGALIELMTSSIRRITKQVEQNDQDVKILTYWLVNTHALVFYLQRDAQTSGKEEDSFVASLRDLMHTVFDALIKCIREMLEPLVRPCILDYENIPGIDTIRYKGDWSLFGRKKPSENTNVPNILPPTPESLMKPAPRRITGVLSSLLVIFEVYSVHPIIVQCIFSQTLYWLGASMFNSVLYNRKYMARSRAMQIRLNVSNLEDWSLNNNCRPSDGSEFSHQAVYKSLMELCRTHFACLTEILQWLQCFSGFGTDFANVVAAMQELKELNPKELLYTARHYRSEVNEPSLSKDYREYLQELAHHYDSQDHDPPPEEPDSILISAKPIVSTDVYLEAGLKLKLHFPNLREMLVYWGGGYDGTDTNNGHTFKPSVPADIADELDKGSRPDDIYRDLNLPQASKVTSQDDEY